MTERILGNRVRCWIVWELEDAHDPGPQAELEFRTDDRVFWYLVDDVDIHFERDTIITNLIIMGMPGWPKGYRVNMRGTHVQAGGTLRLVMNPNG